MSEIQHTSDDNQEGDLCDACITAGQTRSSFPLRKDREDQVLALVHSDIIGPITPPSVDGHKYMCTFIDDHSGYACVQPMGRKDGVGKHFITFMRQAERMTGAKLKILRTDVALNTNQKKTKMESDRR